MKFRLTIGRRLTFGFSLLILTVVGVFASSHRAANQADRAVHDAERLSAWATLMVETELDHFKWLDQLNRTFLENRESVTVRLDDHKCGLGTWMYGPEAAALAVADGKSEALIARLEEPHARLHASGQKIDQLWRVRHSGGSSEGAAKEAAALKVMREETTAHLTEVQGVLHELRAHLDEQSKTAGLHAEAGLTNLSRVNVIAGAFAIVLAIGIGILITRSIVRPIRQMTERLREIAEGDGDLTKTVDQDRSDELGTMGRWFNTFVGRVRRLVVEVAGAAREVASAASEIAASSEEMSRGMEEQTSQVTAVSASAQEMSSSIIEVAHNANEAKESSMASGQTAVEGGAIVGKTLDGMQGIRSAVNASASSVEALGKRADQIGQITEVINDIADQTNLLALNAAIEAARAGEHGRGFAVVADEVRKLATRTTQATEEIAQSIHAIQAETKQAVERMQSAIQQVETGVVQAGSAGDSLRRIVEGATRVATMVESIAAAAEQQSTAGEEVSRSVEAISAVAREASEGARQSTQAAQQLSDKAEQLQALVSRFKLGDDAGRGDGAARRPDSERIVSFPAGEEEWRKAG